MFIIFYVEKTFVDPTYSTCTKPSLPGALSFCSHFWKTSLHCLLKIHYGSSKKYTYREVLYGSPRGWNKIKKTKFNSKNQRTESKRKFLKTRQSFQNQKSKPKSNIEFSKSKIKKQKIKQNFLRANTKKQWSKQNFWN